MGIALPLHSPAFELEHVVVALGAGAACRASWPGPHLGGAKGWVHLASTVIQPSS